MNFKAILSLVILTFAVGCSSLDVDQLETEQTKIVSFLTATHSPKLIAEDDVAESLDVDPEFYSTFGRTAYRYIEDYYNTERDARTVVEMGDKLTITFWCHDFSSYATPSSSNLYYTNDESYRDAFIEAGLNDEYWSFEPLEIILGDGDILNGVEVALEGCREGDYVEVYLTSNLAYTDGWIGVTTLDAPLAFICRIESVEN